MEDGVGVKALSARFNSHAATADSSSRDSGSPKSPRPAFRKTVLPLVTDSDLAHLRLSPTTPFHPMASQGPGRLPRRDSSPPCVLAKGGLPQWAPLQPGAKPSIPLPGVGKVKQTGDVLQSRPNLQPRAPGPKLVPGPPQAPPRASSASSPTAAPLPMRRQAQQRPTGDVTPLRRALPPERPLPLKPKRPPKVNLEPFLRVKHKPAPREPAKTDASSLYERKTNSLASASSLPQPPERSSKPRLPRQVASIDIDQETYDDVASFEKRGSWSDGSQGLIEDNEVYEAIDEDQVEANLLKAEKTYNKGANSQQPQKRNSMEQQKQELRKKFQLEGQVDVLHVARVRYDWSGEGPLDLAVRQDDRVDIIRVKNNPGGKWLARSVSGSYGYISNTCVDIDYEAVKRSLLKSKEKDMFVLPPPPPDPPQMLNLHPSRDSFQENDDDYDDVEPLPGDFPPPPPEMSEDPKTVKELKKKFKYEGSLKAMHSMMVDPNGVIKKPGAKDLSVIHGEILDIIQLSSPKKALCRNQYGKYGYVSRSLLLPMEGDIYDDVDYLSDIYDNDT